MADQQFFDQNLDGEFPQVFFVPWDLWTIGQKRKWCWPEHGWAFFFGAGIQVAVLTMTTGFPMALEDSRHFLVGKGHSCCFQRGRDMASFQSRIDISSTWKDKKTAVS